MRAVLHKLRAAARQAAIASAAIILAAAPCAAQQTPAEPVVLDPVVITATRRAERSFDVAAGIDRIDAATIQQGQPMINLSETLSRVPGLVSQNRQNYAQDLQISSRGFGARAAFGVRGVRLYQDEIPATMPDGQGQTGSFSLLSAESIEVLRGPFSMQYGNASGGVISVTTESGKLPASLTFNASAGSYDTWVEGAKANGVAGALGYVVAASRFDTAGYREHSSARRELVNSKLTIAAGEGTHITLIGSLQDQPGTEDPLGLTRAQWESNPRQVDAAALQFDTRKTIRQQQGGISIEQNLGAGATLRLTGLQAAAELVFVDRIFINDRNSDAAPRYWLANAWPGVEQALGNLTLREYVRINNLADRRYAGSVIVGDANGRSFEPAPGRNWSAGITAVARF